MRLLVADSGPLIVLARIERTDLLDCAADRILVPQAVVTECIRDLALPGAKVLSTVLESLPFQVESAPSPAYRFPESLGAGEKEAIAVADEKRARLLMDDLGARSFATQRGLAVLGIPGLLLLAKQLRAIPWVRPLLESLGEQKYFLSPGLRAEVLRRAGE